MSEPRRPRLRGPRRARRPLAAPAAATTRSGSCAARATRLTLATLVSHSAITALRCSCAKRSPGLTMTACAAAVTCALAHDAARSGVMCCVSAHWPRPALPPPRAPIALGAGPVGPSAPLAAWPRAQPLRAPGPRWRPPRPAALWYGALTRAHRQEPRAGREASAKRKDTRPCSPPASLARNK